MVPPGEVGALLDAEQWGRAHQVLCDAVAPALLCSGREEALARILARLQPHAPAIDAQQGGAAWLRGAGLYRDYLALKVTSAGLGLLLCRPGTCVKKVVIRRCACGWLRCALLLQGLEAQPELAALHDFGERLREASSQQRAASSAPMHGAALALMSADLARWVLSQHHALEVDAALYAEEVAISLEALPDHHLINHMQVAASTLGQVLA